MITKELNPYPYHYQQQITYPPVSSHSYHCICASCIARKRLDLQEGRSSLSLPPPTNPHEMSKWGYSMFLKNLNIKKGDLVRHLWANKPFHERGVYQVVGIDEIHYMVKYGPPAVGPKCLQLCNIFGGREEPAGAKMYVVVADADIPEAWRAKLALQGTENAHTGD